MQPGIYIIKYIFLVHIQHILAQILKENTVWCSNFISIPRIVLMSTLHIYIHTRSYQSAWAPWCEFLIIPKVLRIVNMQILQHLCR